MRAVWLAMAAVILGGSAPPPGPPAWIEGVWRQCRPGGGEVTETWRVGEDMAVGLGVTIRPGASTRFEWMRIAAGSNGGLSFYAHPMGATAETEFPLVESGPQRLVFANPNHDFPQRVTYARDGEFLMATVDAGEGQRRQISWTFRRSPDGEGCPASG